MSNITHYLNNTVFCKIASSPIHNVGVFAIREIKKGQELTDYYGKEFVAYVIDTEDFLSLHPEIQKLITQQTIFEKGKVLRFDSPNSHQILEVFMNHSEFPNSDGKFALRDIEKGEEITKDYRAFLENAHAITKNILNI